MVGGDEEDGLGSGSCFGGTVSAQFGVTFFTSSQRVDTCGTNGLPVTPNSIRILGRSQYLKTLCHPNLATYVDVIRGKSERLIIVAEYFEQNLHKLIRSTCSGDSNKNILHIAKGVLSALAYLNHHGIAVRNIAPENLLIATDGSIKLFNYGLYYMTNCGKYVSFPVGCPKYTSPEVLSLGMKTCSTSYSSDVWSLGIVLVEILIKKDLWSGLKLPQMVEKILQLAESKGDVLDALLKEHESSFLLLDMSDPVKRLLNKCLELNPTKRELPGTILSDRLVFPNEEEFHEEGRNGPREYYKRQFLTCATLPNLPNSFNEEGGDGIQHFGRPIPTDLLVERSLTEIYYLWQRAGGDIAAELKRQGLTRKKPAVLSLPRLMTLEGQTQGKAKERGVLLDKTVVVLPLNELRKRLSDIPSQDFYPLLEFKGPYLEYSSRAKNKESVSLPLIIRERDIEYQFHRLVLFDRLLQGYPYTKSQIQKEAKQDIPPYFRARVWSCLLNIEGDIEYIYNSIDKETATSTDRQIEVDIPRCHQYDELLSSPTGHEKFKRVLKAWVVSNKEYVYWQGLDSLCAPFLSLNFNNEAMAFACLSAFIPKYLYNFFLKDNAVIIQEYLCKFSQLIAFHDPELTNHLDSIQFIPELYAIPWFLTMFSHVFPLHKIFHLWDKLLLGDSSFSLCIGLSILYQLRESLLNSGFNECILLFSDMPEINIEKCVQDSIEIYCSTPKSALRRKYEPPPKLTTGNFIKKSSKFGAFKNENWRLTMERNAVNYTSDALKMDPISLHDLKNEKCSRISGEDFMELLDMHKCKYTKPKMVVVDVRNHEDHNRGAVPGSLNIPFSTAFSDSDGSLVSSPDVNMLNSNRGKIICVIGNRGDSAIKFADCLLSLGYPRVCVLHRGIDIFRTSNLLVVPASI